MVLQNSKYIHLNWNSIEYQNERINNSYCAYEDILGYLLITSKSQEIWENDVRKFIEMIGEDLKSCIKKENINLKKVNELTDILNTYLCNGINYIYNIRKNYIKIQRRPNN